MLRMTSLRFLSPTLLLLLLLAASSGSSVTSPGLGGRRAAEPSSRVVDVADPCKAGELYILGRVKLLSNKVRSSRLLQQNVT